MSTGPRDDLAFAMGRLAREAGRLILALRGPALASTRKPDGSLVTEADLRAEALLRAGLRDLLPGVPIVGEEGETPCQPRDARCFVLVDPLDGTAGFLTGSDEFTVNLALIEDGRPVAAALDAPALGRLFVAGESAHELRGAAGEALTTGASESVRLRGRPWPRAALPVAFVSASNREAGTEALLAALPPHERVPCASSLKFARLAAGEADLHVRAAPLAAWDVAAGDAVLTAAGGAVLTLGGTPLLYRTEASPPRVPPFLAMADGRCAPELVTRLRFEAG